MLSLLFFNLFSHVFPVYEKENSADVIICAGINNMIEDGERIGPAESFMNVAISCYNGDIWEVEVKSIRPDKHTDKYSKTKNITTKYSNICSSNHIAARCGRYYYNGSGWVAFLFGGGIDINSKNDGSSKISKICNWFYGGNTTNSAYFIELKMEVERTVISNGYFFCSLIANLLNTVGYTKVKNDGILFDYFSPSILGSIRLSIPVFGAGYIFYEPKIGVFVIREKSLDQKQYHRVKNKIETSISNIGIIFAL